MNIEVIAFTDAATKEVTLFTSSHLVRASLDITYSKRPHARIELNFAANEVLVSGKVIGTVRAVVVHDTPEHL